MKRILPWLFCLFMAMASVASYNPNAAPSSTTAAQRTKSKKAAKPKTSHSRKYDAPADSAAAQVVPVRQSTMKRKSSSAPTQGRHMEMRALESEFRKHYEKTYEGNGLTAEAEIEWIQTVAPKIKAYGNKYGSGNKPSPLPYSKTS